MNNPASDTIRPNYMQKFRCIGGACEDNCCEQSWRIVFDKRTVNSYLTSKDPEIRDISETSFKKIKKDRSSENYALLRMSQQTGACPFLGTEKLCMIHGRMGEKGLTTVCKTYPRVRGGVGDQFVEVATLSCPEAARLCLLERDAMKLGDTKISLADQLSLTTPPKKLNAIRYLHRTAVEILEDDRVSIIEFVLVYGSALSLLRKNPEQAFAEDRSFSQLQRIITLVRTSFADAHANALQSREAVRFQLGTVLPILVRHSRKNLVKSQRFTKSVFDTLNGLDLDPSELQKSLDLYTGTIAELSQSDRNAMLLGFRNYLINDLLKNAGRYTNTSDDALRSLQAAITRLSIISVQVIGARALVPDCKIEERLPFAVSSTARALEHNPAIMIEIATYLDSIEDKSVAVLGLITPRLE